jgi:hypothetical protein
MFFKIDDSKGKVFFVGISCRFCKNGFIDCQVHDSFFVGDCFDLKRFGQGCRQSNLTSNLGLSSMTVFVPTK